VKDIQTRQGVFEFLYMRVYGLQKDKIRLHNNIFLKAKLNKSVQSCDLNLAQIQEAPRFKKQHGVDFFI
jgi:hypothetical protein